MGEIGHPRSVHVVHAIVVVVLILCGVLASIIVPIEVLSEAQSATPFAHASDHDQVVVVVVVLIFVKVNIRRCPSRCSGWSTIPSGQRGRCLDVSDTVVVIVFIFICVVAAVVVVVSGWRADPWRTWAQVIGINDAVVVIVFILVVVPAAVLVPVRRKGGYPGLVFTDAGWTAIVCILDAIAVLIISCTFNENLWLKCRWTWRIDRSLQPL